jgi:glycosyltransferase involved in cell wall biosynthesis
MLGVTIAIPCHNSAKLLPTTLEHLREQQVPPALPWEVIVIDNASTDDTAEVAHSCWRGFENAPLRVVHEPHLGSGNARWRGLASAKHEIVSFLDDDNWAAPDWVAVASQVLSEDRSLAAVGPIINPVFEVQPPPWFDEFAGYYAIVRESELARRKFRDQWIAGAGYTLRREAGERLLALGFTPSCSGNVGTRHNGGEDLELTFALRSLGYRLAIESRLRLEHFLPKGRLSWRYLRHLARTYGASYVTLEAYMSDARLERSQPAFKRTWWWQLLRTARMLGSSERRWVWAWLFSRREGDWNVINGEDAIGRMVGLTNLRGEYATIFWKTHNWLAGLPAATQNATPPLFEPVDDARP